MFQISLTQNTTKYSFPRCSVKTVNDYDLLDGFSDLWRPQSPRAIGFIFGMGKLKWLGYNQVKATRWSTQSFGTTNQRDRRTDRQWCRHSKCRTNWLRRAAETLTVTVTADNNSVLHFFLFSGPWSFYLGHFKIFYVCIRCSLSKLTLTTCNFVLQSKVHRQLRWCGNHITITCRISLWLKRPKIKRNRLNN